jgi:hypothetical protein
MAGYGNEIVKYCYACGKGIMAFESNEDYARAGRCLRCNHTVMEEFCSLYQKASDNNFSSVEELKEIAAFLENNFIEPKTALQFVRDELLFYIELEANDEITSEAVARIKGLEAQLNLSPKFVQQIDEEIEYLKTILEVKKGKLPTTTSSLVLPAGEILHYQTTADYEDEKSIGEPHKGRLFITSQRVIFQSPTKKFDFPYHKVVEVLGGDPFITINLSRGLGSGTYTVPHNHLVGEMIKWLVKTASRQVIAPQTGATRFIPQEVKIEVWQRDQGRCVQCGAQEYLEFDHVIPLSMGGATSANNLQLLCRKCNLAKGGRL